MPSQDALHVVGRIRALVEPLAARDLDAALEDLAHIRVELARFTDELTAKRAKAPPAARKG